MAWLGNTGQVFVSLMEGSNSVGVMSNVGTSPICVSSLKGMWHRQGYKWEAAKKI